MFNSGLDSAILCNIIDFKRFILEYSWILMVKVLSVNFNKFVHILRLCLQTNNLNGILHEVISAFLTAYFFSTLLLYRT